MLTGFTYIQTNWVHLIRHFSRLPTQKLSATPLRTVADDALPSPTPVNKFIADGLLPQAPTPAHHLLGNMSMD